MYSLKTEEPVNEFDSPHPDTPYGKSKRAGEAMVRDTMAEHIILRSSWLYSKDGGMMKAALAAATAGEKLPARMDQYAAPTSIALYAKYLCKALERRAYGTFHVACTGKASRYEFAQAVLELAGYDPATVLVPTTDARTSETLVLESLMLEIFGADIPSWKDELASYMKAEGLTK